MLRQVTCMSLMGKTILHTAVMGEPVMHKSVMHKSLRFWAQPFRHRGACAGKAWAKLCGGLTTLLCGLPAVAQTAPATTPLNAGATAKSTVPAPVLSLPYKDNVGLITFAPDGKTLAGVSTRWQEQVASTQIMIWDTRNGEIKLSWAVTRSVSAIAYAPDGKMLATGSADKVVTLWNPADGAVKRTLTGHTNRVQALAFAPDGKTLASGSMRIGNRNLVGELYLWDMATGQRREIIMEEAGSVDAIAFSADGTKVAAKKSQFVAGLWDVQTLELKQSYQDKSLRGVIVAVAISPDGQKVATGSLGHGLHVWDATTGQLQHALLQIKEGWNGLGPSGSVDSIAFLPSGTALLSAGKNQEGPGGYSEVFLWDLQTATVKQTFSEPTAQDIGSIAVSSDGKLLACVKTFAKTINLWQLP